MTGVVTANQRIKNCIDFFAPLYVPLFSGMYGFFKVLHSLQGVLVPLIDTEPLREAYTMPLVDAEPPRETYTMPLIDAEPPREAATTNL